MSDYKNERINEQEKVLSEDRVFKIPYLISVAKARNVAVVWILSVCYRLGPQLVVLLGGCANFKGLPVIGGCALEWCSGTPLPFSSFVCLFFLYPNYKGVTLFLYAFLITGP